MIRQRNISSYRFAVLACFTAILLVNPAAPISAKPVSQEGTVDHDEWYSINIKSISVVSPQVNNPRKKNKPPTIHIGKLKFLDGITLTSQHKNFGGFSGIRLIPNTDRLIAISDRVHFLEVQYQTNDEGAITKLHNGRMSRIVRSDGSRLDNFGGDAEGLELTPDGIFVSFERYHRIDTYTKNNHGNYRVTNRILDNAKLEHLKSNKGLESIIALKDGRILTLAESIAKTQKSKAIPGWIMHNDVWEPVSYQASKRFSVTDLSQDKSTAGRGDIYVLERAYSKFKGIQIKIKRFPVTALNSNTLIKAEELATMTFLHGMDNMEGLDVTRHEDGRLILYLISDDNFNSAQRTLLYSYEIEE